ncbi:MAG: STAS domain-containing protein [Ramlibacter sp.]|nr:STAS domain-containing protein [Ramlibacter sp.]MCW5649468.1 STAS domain-containing protein [Ramlibacter sp.]
MDTNTSYPLQGRLDGVTSAGHQEALLALLDGGVQSLVMDLSQLDYVSSMGLRTLLIVAKAAKARGGSVVLRAPKPAILEVLTISGFDTILQVQG